MTYQNIAMTLHIPYRLKDDFLGNCETFPMSCFPIAYSLRVLYAEGVKYSWKAKTSSHVVASGVYFLGNICLIAGLKSGK